jgi:hypothetical protein
MRPEPRMDRLDEAVGRAWEVLESLRETPRWLLAFSGGKDSTTVLVLAVEFLRQQRPAGVSLEILYADTLLEIPPMARHAEGMLAHAEALAEAEGLPLRVRRLRPPPDQTFWVLVLGKGYPVPSFRFRWCTDRLKVRPMRRAAEQGDPNAVMLVGVREGESAVRDGRLRQACGRGECGPAAGRGLWGLPAPALTPTAPRIGPTRTPAPTRAPTPAPAGNCHPAYPTVCIPPPPPDLDCGDIPYHNFPVDRRYGDPHRFDGDQDGIGCER